MAVAEAHQTVVEVPEVALGDAARRAVRRMIANAVSRRGTPRMKKGTNSGAKKK